MNAFSNVKFPINKVCLVVDDSHLSSGCSGPVANGVVQKIISGKQGRGQPCRTGEARGDLGSRPMVRFYEVVVKVRGEL